jgi:hypothetical protein
MAITPDFIGLRTPLTIGESSVCNRAASLGFSMSAVEVCRYKILRDEEGQSHRSSAARRFVFVPRQTKATKFRCCEKPGSSISKYPTNKRIFREDVAISRHGAEAAECEALFSSQIYSGHNYT